MKRLLLLLLCAATTLPAQTVRATRTRNVVEDAKCAPDTGWETRPERYTSATAATAAARVKKTCPVVTPPVDTQPTPPPVVVPPVVTPPAGCVPNAPSMIGMFGQPACWVVQGPGARGVGSDKAETGPATAATSPGSPDFRTVSQFVKMGVFDPIVYPGRDTIGHLHQFFGNVGITPFSTTASLTTSGRSASFGGILNRSAYWSPAMYNSTNGQIIPVGESFIYYKGSYNLPWSQIQSIPAGLHIIAGNKNATGWQGGYPYYNVHWFCNGVESMDGTIPACAPGGSVDAWVAFPQCWDGKRLSTPDLSHMAYADYNAGRCPSTHPIQIPQLTEIFHWAVRPGDNTANWRLTSDGMVPNQKPGQSMHADYMIAWDEATLAEIVKNCLNTNTNCQVNLLGNGRELRLAYMGWP